ncbi:unnamed protein product [Allacma fusca]|uniref:Peptidase M12B domain-containing protein n=1 Tax=Allacma fusca TaxID=39272 RepID=A0A8J2K1S8_9HEXA|nr:unnamed protein product [Allacma fusca]
MMYSLEPKMRFNGTSDANGFHEIPHTLAIVEDLDADETDFCATSQMNLIPPGIKGDYEENEVQMPSYDESKGKVRQDNGNRTSKQYLSFIENISPRQYPVGSGQSRTVELAIFADQSFIEYLFKKLNSTSLQEIQGYLHVLTHITSINFKHPSLESHVNFRIVHEEFWYQNPKGFNNYNGTLPKFLESFCSYAYSQNLPSGGKNWDHAMLFTASELTNAHKNVSYGGVAYLSGSCTDRSSCSIVKAKNFYGASTMTHEMGHSLGMNHDGQENNLKCPSTGYFMSGTSGSGRVSWSSCSNKNLLDFFTFLDGTNEKYPFKFGRKYRKDCLKTFTSSTKYYTAYSASKLPGEEFPPKFQCAFASERFPLVNNWDTKNFCKKLYCGDASQSLMWEIHAPLEGSECEEGKVNLS